tara:strand:- start:2591 stop:2797 length:207 start_codon:yes stop_codon:yes gene_type:complete
MESSLRNQAWKYDSVTIGFLGMLKQSLKDASVILPIHKTVDETLIQANMQKGFVQALNQIIQEIEEIE